MLLWFACSVVKAGGMRVTQHKPAAKAGENPPAEEPSVEEDGSEEQQQLAAKDKPSPVVVAGFETQVGMKLFS